MKILIQKFGGTSVAEHANRLLAARKTVHAKDAGFAPVVVVSAIGRKGAPYATDSLAELLKNIDPQVTPEARGMDMMMACGEIISAVIFAQTLQTMGVKAIALTGGQAGIVTDSQFSNARVLEVRPACLLSLIERGYVPVVCGFQGVTDTLDEFDNKAVTTLGRGGSDTTASALGVALNAVAVEIYTDVDGVKTADPHSVATAKTIDLLTYEEVAEMAHQGAKVVHPRAAEIAMDHDIPLWVKSTFSDAPGTKITRRDAPDAIRSRITGITHTGKLVYIRVQIDNEEHKPFVEREVYRMMAKAGVSIFLVTFNQNALSFCVPRAQYPIAKDLLDGMVVPVPLETPDSEGRFANYYIFRYLEGLDLAYRVQRPLLELVAKQVNIVDVPITAVENCTIVSVIALKQRRATGVMTRIYQTLLDAKITIYQTADSEMSITCLIPESEVDRAVRLLHAELIDKT